ncbi:MAG: hypothetical protein ACOX3I_00570 [Limnochordia bacterium]
MRWRWNNADGSVSLHGEAGEMVAADEPICLLANGGAARVERHSGGRVLLHWDQVPAITAVVEHRGQGAYGQEVFQIEVAARGGLEQEMELLPPFCRWTLTGEQISSCSPEYLYVREMHSSWGGLQAPNGVLGGFGRVRVFPLKGEFCGSQFVTAPAGDGQHCITASLHLLEGKLPLQGEGRWVYELHLDCLEGNRNTVLQEIFRVRGGYLVNPAEYDYSRYEEMPWVKDVVAAFINWSWDKDVLDPRTGEYKIVSTLEKAKERLGGFDLYEFWPFWPRAGFDERDQFAHFEDMPGGLAGLRNEIDKIHSLGTRIILGYCYWSEYDRVGADAWESEKVQSYNKLLDLAAAVDADGAVMDCMSSTPDEIIEGSRQRGKALLPYNEGDPSWWESQTNLLGPHS